MTSSEAASPDSRPNAGGVPVDFDSELQLHHPLFMRACAIAAHERVLDIGCGAGQTTRDAARAATAGGAYGVDVMASSIAGAREQAAAQGLRNVRFEQGDAQTYPFPAHAFDVAISRYGTMFFTDPAAAFRHVRGVLTDQGRLVMMVWQAREANEWTTAIHGANAQSPAAFSLGDPATVERVLDAAGFTQVTFQDVQEPVYYGDSIEAALEWIGQFQATKAALQSLDVAAAERERARMRDVVAQHYRDGGVWFGSRSWIVSARCR